MSSRDNDIRKLIGIQDKAIKKLKYREEKYIANDIEYLVYTAKLTRKCKECSHCGSRKLVKNGNTVSKIRDNTKYPIIIKLTKSRYKCKECGRTSTPETTYAKKYSRFSEGVKAQILKDLEDKRSQKSIAKSNFVSPSYVSRIIRDYLITKKSIYNYLPEAICIDEFKSIKGMSFIFCDAETKDVINVFESRKNHDLINAFNQYSEEAKNNVKIVVMDMFSPYISLVKQVFKNAEIVIDRFHIVKLFTTAFNNTRIHTMKEFPKSTLQYKRLKNYWKLFLKNIENVERIKFRKFSFFNKRMISEETVISESLKANDRLMDTYEVYQYLLLAMRNRDFKLFKNIMIESIDLVSEQMKDKFRNIQKFMPYIENSFKYKYSNGPLEGINNTIKVLNKVSYGFRNFEYYRARILHTLNSPYHILK